MAKAFPKHSRLTGNFALSLMVDESVMARSTSSFAARSQRASMAPSTASGRTRSSRRETGTIGLLATAWCTRFT